MYIRTFREADRQAIIMLWRACNLVRPWNDPSHDIDRVVNTRNSSLLVGVMDDVIVATAMLGFDGHRGWIYYVAVAVSHRRKGLGVEIMSEAELWLRSRGAPKVQLMVRSDNTDITGFYGALDYEHLDVVVLGKLLEDD